MLRVVAAGESALASSTGLQEALLARALAWLAVSLLCALLYWAVALYIFRRRGFAPVDRGTLLEAFWLSALAGSALYLEARTFTAHEPLFSAVVPILFLLFFYLRSDGRFASNRVRWLAVFFVLSQVGPFGSQQAPSQQDAHYIAQLPGLLLGGFELVGNVITVTTIVIGLLPQIYARFRHRIPPDGLSVVDRAHPPRRWHRWAVGLSGGFLLLAVASALESPSSAAPSAVSLTARTGFFLGAVLLPAAAAFALARGRAFDRDALANRALIYGMLTAGLLAIYGVCAGVLAILFPGFETLSTAVYLPFLVVIALLMNALYRPLLGQIRQRIDRRFFRRRYEATSALAAFSATLHAEPQLERLSDRMVAAVAKAFCLADVTLWVPAAVTTPARRPISLLAGAVGGAEEVQANDSAAAPASEIRLRRQAGTTAATTPTVTLAIAGDDPVCPVLLWGTRPLSLDRLPPESPTTNTLRAAEVRLALPMVGIEGALRGLLGLSAPASGPAYTEDERELLGTLAAEMVPALAAATAAHGQEVEAHAREQAEQELQTARRIQEALLPKVVPQLAGWQIAALYQPARAVGGDFYDFIELGDGQLGLVLGDVTDKGIPAALVMATTRSMLRAVAVQQGASPGGVLAQVNELLCADLPPSMFVTCFYAILDPANGRLRFANAGQDLPYCRREGGEVGELRATGMPLGLMPGMRYEEQETALAAGESVLFYSDGLVEAHNPRREMFGFPRLSALLASRGDATPPIVFLLSELAAFTGPDWEQEDDITLVALRRGDDGGAPLAAPSP